MRTIALISDIHANLPALKRVLKHARGHGAGEIWNAGDSVGYGPDPEGVMKRLRKEGVLSVMGNYDLKVLRYPEKREKWRGTKHPLKLKAIAWAHERLGRKSLEELAAQPKKRRFRVRGIRCLLTHGSPESVGEHLRPSTPNSRLKLLAQRAKAELVACGHTHNAFDRDCGGVLWINAGSVGRPNDGDPRASYALLRFKRDRVVVVKRYRLEYDVERAVAGIRDGGQPEVFARMLLEGRNLEDVC